MNIGFRVWDTSENKIIDCNFIYMKSSGEYIQIVKGKEAKVESRYKVQKQSLHKDPYGRVIYEGDIVMFMLNKDKISISTISIDNTGSFIHKLDFFGVIGAKYYATIIGNENEPAVRINSRIKDLTALCPFSDSVGTTSSAIVSKSLEEVKKYITKIQQEF